jgi:ketosteroid isomerase-like protein
MIRTRAGEQTLNERETIVFRRDGDRWAAVHEHLSPQPAPAQRSPDPGQSPVQAPERKPAP